MTANPIGPLLPADEPRFDPFLAGDGGQGNAKEQCQNRQEDDQSFSRQGQFRRIDNQRYERANGGRYTDQNRDTHRHAHPGNTQS